MTVHIDPQGHKQLRRLALEEDLSVQALAIEALNLLFASRQLPEIADPTKPNHARQGG